MSYSNGLGHGRGGFRSTSVFYDAIYPEHIDYVSVPTPGGAPIVLGNYVAEVETDYMQPYEEQVNRSFTRAMRGQPAHRRALSDSGDGLGGVLAVL